MKLPWQRVAEKAQREVENAEKRLIVVRAQRVEAEEHAKLARYWLTENHISPKLRAVIREGRR